LPVTTTGALGLLVLAAEFVLAAGLLVVAGALLAVLDDVFTGPLFPQDIAVAARATTRINTGNFIQLSPYDLIRLLFYRFASALHQR
jgi:hypothetical protein